MATTVCSGAVSASLERAIHPAWRLRITRSCDDETLGSADSCLVARLDAAEALNGSDVASTGPRGPWRLSRPVGFWVVATSVLCVSAFSTAPSSLDGLYAERDHLSSLTITIVYAVYAGGIVVSLLLAGHISDWYGRRAVLVPALVVGAAASAIFVFWKSLPGLLVGRVLTGVAIGVTVATATAYLTDLDVEPKSAVSCRASTVAVIGNLGGLALGPLIAGLLAHFASHALTLPYMVFFCAIVISAIGVYFTPEGHPARHPLPRYAPQRLKIPSSGRGVFVASITGAFTGFAVSGLFVALTGTFLPAGSRFVAGPDRLDRVSYLRCRRRDPAVDLGLATAPALPVGDCPDSGWAVPVGHLGVDIPAEPHLVLGQRGDRGHRRRRRVPGQPGHGHLHLERRRSGGRSGHCLHRRLRRCVHPGDRRGLGARTCEPAGHAPDLRDRNGGRDRGGRARLGPSEPRESERRCARRWSRVMSDVSESPASAQLAEADIALFREIGTSRHVHEGEYLYREGDVSYDFFVVVSAEVDIIVRADGADRIVGHHGAGRFLGELNMLTGLRVFVSARVTKPGEVIAVPRERLRTVMTTNARLGDTILAAFIARRSLLLENAAPTIRVVGSRFSPESLRVREFLSRIRVPHEWLDADSDPQVQGLLRETGIGAGDLPVVIATGSVLRNPTPGELSSFLGLTLENLPQRCFDLLVIGGGPAGLAAAVYGASEGLQTLGVDSTAPGGQAGTSSRIENYLGFPMGISGAELTQRAVIQAQKFGARLTAPCTAKSLRENGGYLVVELSDGSEVAGRAVVAATGASYRRLDAARLEDFEGRGVYYAATDMEARQCRGAPVVIVGGGNSAGQAAIFLAQNSCPVSVVIRSEDLAKSMSQYLVDRIEADPAITVRTNTSVIALDGDESLEVVQLRGAEGEYELECRALFSFIGRTLRRGGSRVAQLSTNVDSS